MIKLERTEVFGFEPAIRGMRNPKNSWENSDSRFIIIPRDENDDTDLFEETYTYIGENDLKLMVTLANAGNDHSKFLRMIVVYVDATAPMFWWKEYDTYKIGTVANSCSTMHKLISKPITYEDFSWNDFDFTTTQLFKQHIENCESLRKEYLATKDVRIWENLIQALPMCYNQKRTLMLNYAVLRNIYHSRKNHKLKEWHTFCKWIETLPYAQELIIN